MWRAALALAGLLLLTAGCGEDADGGSSAVSVVATTTQAADLVGETGGSRVEVDALLARGADPHGYEPRPSDVAALADADLIVRSGGEVDAWTSDLIEGSGADAPVVELIDAVDTIPGDGGEPDAHWWQDPRAAVRAVEAIRKALVAADPKGRDAYTRTASAYTSELRRLNRDLEACFEQVQPARRKIVTTHDALGYLARAYDIDVVGAVIPSLSTQAQPSAADVDALVRQIEQEGVKAVFPESGISEKLERAIARESGAQVGGALWADTLGPEGSGAETYVGAMRANADALVRGMSGGWTGCSG